MKLKLFIGSLIALIIVAGFVLGFYLGQNKGLPGDIGGKNKAELQKIVDNIYSPPPTEMFALSGVVQGIYGATLKLEINDPYDYLPHTDGTPRFKKIRFASVISATTYTLVDHSKGSPVRSKIKLNDIKIDDYVLVKSNSNIRDAEKFDITAVEVVKY